MPWTSLAADSPVGAERDVDRVCGVVRRPGSVRIARATTWRAFPAGAGANAAPARSRRKWQLQVARHLDWANIAESYYQCQVCARESRAVRCRQRHSANAAETPTPSRATAARARVAVLASAQLVVCPS